MIKIKLGFKFFVFSIIFSLIVPQSSYALTDGILATDLLGQYDQTSFTSPVPIYTKSVANDGPNRFGFNDAEEVAIDSTNHRLFVSDYGNNRVLVYNLNSDNTFIDRVPDYVLGQSNFYTNTAALTASGMSLPLGIAYDATNNRLFVSQQLQNRVLVFDVSIITNGEDAINVLGQANFTSSTNAANQTTIANPGWIEYDPTGQRLFVVEQAFGGNNRVSVWDVASITNGEAAVNVLGQPDFTTISTATSSTKANNPLGAVYDSVNQRLFVSQFSANRIMIYNLADGITDGEAAVNVLGQANFTSSAAATTAIGLSIPAGLAYDSTNSRLFVAEGGNRRVKVYDVLAITDGEAAVNVLGQANFTTSTGVTTQSSTNDPWGIEYDSTSNRLFVSQGATSRVSVFDVASITDGENAVDLLGHYDQTSFTDPVPVYTTSTANDGPNKFGFSAPQFSVFDTVNHRFFVSDYGNNRVLVYNLNSSNFLVDKIPDYVLGQPNFYTNTAATSISGMRGIEQLAYDSTNQRLFVVDEGNKRVLVFDVTSITNGEDAINVLGQANFTTSASATTQAGFNSQVWGVAYDSTNDRLFVGDRTNNRVLVFDTTSIVDGENAVNVLGQADFVTSTSTVTQSRMNSPRGLAYDNTNSRLFVAEASNNRVLVFDVSSITNGENAVNVLGQANFTSNNAATTQVGMSSPQGPVYDAVNNRLFLADVSNRRILVYDVSSIVDGEAAINVLGQADFTSSTSATTQSGLGSNPRGVSYNSSTNQIFVTEEGNNRISIFSLSGPTLSEVTPVGTVVNNAILNYTFNTNVAGTISYGGSCTSSTTVASIGNNTITFSPLTPGIYNDCTITVTDVNTYASSPLSISPVNIVVHSGGTSSVVIIPQVQQNPITPITTIPPIITTTPTTPIPTVCNTGDLFSITTGLACTMYTPATNTTNTCPATQILTQNLKAGARNGQYHSYTKGIVKEVRILQAHMNRLGFASGKEDGILGPITDGAIKRMQKQLGTTQDGLIGPITRGLINGSCGGGL